MILALRILPFVLLIAVAIFMVWRTKSLKGAANEIPMGLNSLFLAILGSIGLFGAFVAVAEIITRL
tara:strand:- start:54 stop:251 length:198 start_codon:yes stop_codon:yes gene_type:complete